MLLRGRTRAAIPGPGPEQQQQQQQQQRQQNRQHQNHHVVPALLARIEEAEGRPDRALAGYLRAIELGDRDQAVIRRAAQLLTERGRHADADEVLRKAADARGAGPGGAAGAGAA